MSFKTVAFALSVMASGGSSATEALIAASDYIPEAQATADEAQALSTARSHLKFRSVGLVNINTGALARETISITTPDGVTREFVGSHSKVPGRRRVTPDGRPTQFPFPGKDVWSGAQVGGTGRAEFTMGEEMLSGQVETQERTFYFAGHCCSRVLTFEK